MTSDQVRDAFLGFFEEKGHKIIASSSLIPKGDPTLLLTTAGMVQFKPYFLGEMPPPHSRLASCQKCFRTTDVEVVGDATHLTFFEMLGNFSMGDYFKLEAIDWAWEFVTQRLSLPPERLWVTIFLDDDESYQYWRQVGVPETRILRFGETDNFWGPAGDSGPCGPCSEIHYDFGEDTGCGQSTCAPNCSCGRFSEVWNLVFTQYNQDKQGNRVPLPRPNIDTGMGLERATAAVNGQASVYDTDLFLPLLKLIAKMAGSKYGKDTGRDNAMRVIAEHSRGIAFLIADGVIPANEGRGYVLRRLLRRAALFGRRLGFDQPFLADTAAITIDQMGHVYPELEQRRDFILKVIGVEETRFEETLNTGLELMENIMAQGGAGQTVSGEDAFRLYDTYGFPVELTKEIAAGRGLAVDLAGFEREMEQQRERARAAHKFEVAESANLGGQLALPATEFVGYHQLEHSTSLVGILVDNESVDAASEKQAAGLILQATPFYGEMGGQLGDTGEICGDAARFSVSDTIWITPEIILHRGRVARGSFAVGDQVRAKVDQERRGDIARNHTATHLLHYALRQVLGEHVQQRGSQVAPDHFRFDFSHLQGMTKEEIRQVQQIVNREIRRNLPVYDQELSYQQAIDGGAIALFDEKYGETVRVLKIGQPVISSELCGGTHVTTTGEISFFQVITESSIGSGLRRIEAVTGRGAEEFINRQFSRLDEVAQKVGASLDDVVAKVAGLLDELDRERKQAMNLETELARKVAESLIRHAEVINGVMVLVAQVPPTRLQPLREMCDLLREQLQSAVIVLGTVYDDKPLFMAAVTEDLITRGLHAGEIVKQVAKETGGGGGGKAGLAQAGGRDKTKVAAALKLVKGIITGQSQGGNHAQSGA